MEIRLVKATYNSRGVLTLAAIVLTLLLVVVLGLVRKVEHLGQLLAIVIVCSRCTQLIAGVTASTDVELLENGQLKVEITLGFVVG